MLKLIPLGGLGEIGKNMTVYEYGRNMIVVDCGVMFPDSAMYGIDLVLPDFEYVIENQDKLRGIVLTHGHMDHIAGLPYLLRNIDAPIYGTPLTLGLLAAGGRALPGLNSDRADIILGALQANISNNYPSVSGILLTGGLIPEETIIRLIEGLSEIVPIISVEGGTYSVTNRRTLRVNSSASQGFSIYALILAKLIN